MWRRIGFICTLLGWFVVAQSSEMVNITEIVANHLRDIKIPTSHNVTIFNSKEVLNRLLTSASDECTSQVEMLIAAQLIDTMFDSWSKFYPGMFNYATKVELGNYDQCMSIDYTGTDGRVLGKYCVAGLLIPTSLDVQDTNFIANILKMSTCIPNKCTSQDLSDSTGLPIFTDLACTTKEDDTTLDAGAIVTIVIIAVVLFLMIAQTALDVWYYITEQKPSNPYSVAFSVFSNTKKLFKNAKKGGEQILCFNGMKCISMVWIIGGHGAAPWEAIPTTYVNAYSDWFNSRDSQYLQTAKFAVETFFFISGFLMAYQYFKSEVKKPIVTQVSSVPIMIVHRYLRLTPAVLMLFLYVTYLAKYLGNGPLYSYGQKTFSDPCKDNWWAFFLYIQNYHNPTDLCITATWYLSADMQLFLFTIPVTIVLAIIYKQSLKLVLASLLGLNLIFLVIPIATKLLLTKDSNPTLSYEYDTHSRLIAYFIGFMFGLFVRTNRTNFKKINQKLNLLVWLAVLVVMYMITYVTHGIQTWGEYNAKALSISFARPLWCLCLCWIVYSCLVGQGGVINWFLSSGVMQVGAKLSYCLYLVHGPVISFLLLQTRTTLHFSDYVLFYNFCGHLVISLLVSTFWTLAFESPLMILERAILGGARKKRAPNPPRKISDATTDASKTDVSTVGG